MPGRAAYQDFFALWKDADPDIPILKEAKAEYGRVFQLRVLRSSAFSDLRGRESVLSQGGVPACHNQWGHLRVGIFSEKNDSYRTER